MENTIQINAIHIDNLKDKKFKDAVGFLD